MHIEPALLPKSKLEDIRNFHAGDQTPAAGLIADLIGHIDAMNIEHAKFVKQTLEAKRDTEPVPSPPAPEANAVAPVHKGIAKHKGERGEIQTPKEG